MGPQEPLVKKEAFSRTNALLMVCAEGSTNASCDIPGANSKYENNCLGVSNPGLTAGTN